MKSIIVNRINIYLALILFVFVIRHSLTLTQFPIAHAFFSGTRVLCWLTFIYLFLIHLPKPDKMGWGFLAYFTIVTISSVVGHTDEVFSLISDIGDIFVFWGICVIYLRDKVEFIIRALVVSLCMCIYLNFLLMLEFRTGLWWDVSSDMGFYLLGGNYNQMGRTLLPAIGIHGYYTLRFNKWHTNFYILIAVSIVTLLLVKSMTSLVCLLMVIAFFFIRNERPRHIFMITLLVFYLLFQIVVVFLQQDLHSYTFIAYFVEDVLHKDLTFTHRTSVWADGMDMIMKSPLIGYGYKSHEWYADKFWVVTSHNFIIDELIRGGFLLGLVDLYLGITAIKSYLNNKARETQYFAFSCLTFLFMMLMEVYMFAYVAMMLLLLAYSNYLVSPKEEQ